MSGNLQDLLNARADEQEKPKPLPTGTYLSIFDGQPKYDKINDVDVANFMIKPVRPSEDVRADILNEQGGIGERRLRHTFWLRAEDLWKVTDLCTKLGMDVEGKTVGQLFAALPGTQCMVKVKHVPSKDGSEVFANVEHITGV